MEAQRGKWLAQGHTAGVWHSQARNQVGPIWCSLLTLDCDNEASWDSIPGTGVQPCFLHSGDRTPQASGVYSEACHVVGRWDGAWDWDTSLSHGQQSI